MGKIYVRDCYYEITYQIGFITRIPCGLIFQVDRDDSNKEYFTKKIKGEQNNVNLSDPNVLQYVLAKIDEHNHNLLALPIKNIEMIDIVKEINLNELSDANIRNIIASLIIEEDKHFLINELKRRNDEEISSTSTYR